MALEQGVHGEHDFVCHTVNDPIASRFSDIGIPGRRPVNRGGALPEVYPDQWDAKPIKYMVKGEMREFFSIGALAAALGVSVQSIRAWENKGLMPRSPYRSPRPRKDMLPGVTKGKRLWTRDQINGILRIAREEQVILNKKPPTVRFAQRAATLYIELLNTPHTGDTP